MAAKSAYPNNVATPAAKGQSASRAPYPNKPATKAVAGGGKTAFPNAGSGPKQPGKATAPAPSSKSAGPGPEKTNVVGGVLGKLRSR